MRVGVTGAAGRMGREVCKTVLAAPDMSLVFAVDLNIADATDYAIESDLGYALGKGVDAVVDFTHPNAAAQNALQILDANAVPIIGTSGVRSDDLKSIGEKATERSLSALYIPNFAIGAVLMMKFAQEAAKYLPEVEIIEMHHDKKADAPSGTAIRTAEMIAEARTRDPIQPKTEMIKHEGATGAVLGKTHVHSVRLPGLVAHQMVMFGAPGESLTIRHDSLDRSSFMSGVALAIRNCRKHKGLVVGLENLL